MKGGSAAAARAVGAVVGRPGIILVFCFYASPQCHECGTHTTHAAVVGTRAPTSGFTMSRTVQIVVLLCAVVAASASRQHAWVNTHASPGDGYEHKVVVALKQSNVEQLREIVEAVSTPGSASYGKYLTLDEVTNIGACLCCQAVCGTPVVGGRHPHP